MPFCPGCGNAFTEGDSFCIKCGRSLTALNTIEVRKEVFQGVVRKCPACGAEVPSMTARCPICGHEYNSGKVASSISQFASGLQRLDAEIAAAAHKRTGFSSWGCGIQCAWIVINCIFVFLPMLIYPFLVKSNQPEIETKKNEKAAFISNYVFPNDRESIIEAQFFIKSKISEVVNGHDCGAEKNRWKEIWAKKSIQLHQKAVLVMGNDPVETQIYNEIMKINKKHFFNLSI